MKTKYSIDNKNRNSIVTSLIKKAWHHKAQWEADLPGGRILLVTGSKVWITSGRTKSY